MVQRYQLTIFWDARERPTRTYAEDVLQLMKALGAIDPSRMTEWYPAEGGPNRAQLDVDRIEADLLAGEHDWRHGSTSYRAFTARYSNAQPAGKEVTIEILCGINQPSVNVWFPNRLDVFFFGPQARAGYDDAGLIPKWLDVAIAIFEPRWGAVGPKGMVDQDWEDFAGGRPQVGWMVYLSKPYGPTPSVPPPARAAPMRGGMLFVAIDDWFDPSSQAHAAARQQLIASLDAANMRPLAVAIVDG